MRFLQFEFKRIVIFYFLEKNRMSLKTFFKKTNKNGPVSILSNLKERSHMLTLTERFLHVAEEVKYKTVFFVIYENGFQLLHNICENIYPATTVYKKCCL
jgi:hypothetical protein